MTLPTNGPITLGDVAYELGESYPMQLGDADARALANKKTGTITLGDLYAADQVQFALSAATSGSNVGFSSGVFGALTPAAFNGSTIVFAADITGTGFRLSLAGTHDQLNTFRSVSINGHLYYAADATFSATAPSTWTWTPIAGIVGSQSYALNINIGPEDAGVISNGGPLGQNASDWTLSFEDTFSGTTLDTSKWNDAIWYEDPDPVVNYSVSGGALKIWPMSNWANRTIDTDGKFSQQYGYFEMRAKLPTGKGIAPAFWLNYHGNDGDTPGIDVMKTYCGSIAGSTSGATALTIVFFGDGRFWGTDGSQSDPWTRVTNPLPALIDTYVDARYSCDNYGYPGITMQKVWSGWSAQGVPSFSTYFPTINSDIVLFNCCIEDAAEGLGVANYKQRVRDLINFARGQGKYAILVTPNETSNTAVDAYRTGMLEVAAELGVSVIDVYTMSRNYRILNSLSLTTLCPDGKTPTQTFYNVIAEWMSERFNEIIADDTSAPKLQSSSLGYANNQLHPINYAGNAYANTGEWLGGSRLPYMVSVSYTIDSATNIDNPERGFCWAIGLNGDTGITAETPMSVSELNDKRSTDGRTLYFLLLYLNDSVGSNTLNPTLLSRFATQMANFRTAGVKCILRPSYNQDGGKTDAPVARVLLHLDALAPTIQAYSDVLFGVQAGFVGPWGEWWQSDNFGDVDLPSGETLGLTPTQWANRKAVVDKWLSILPSNLKVMVRMPAYKRNMYGSAALSETEALGTSARARVGHHNDAFVSSDTDMGTYLSSDQSEYPYLAQETKYLPIGGESAAYVSPRGDAPNAEYEMALFHYTYLNEFYHQGVIGSWRDANRLELIRKKLGYRIALVDADFPANVAPGALMSFNLTIRNEGYAAPVNPRTVYLILRKTGSGAVTSVPLPVEIRRWLPGSDISESVTVTLPSNLTLGTYDLALHLPDPSSTLGADPRCSIRLANSGVWESTTGYNLLGHTVTAASVSNTASAATDLSFAFHTYGMKWDTNGDITWYFDGQLVASFDSTQNLDKIAAGTAISHAMYPALSIWYGGESGAPNTTDTPTGASNSFEIDYVRIWTKATALPAGTKIAFFGNSTLRGYNGTGYYGTTPVAVFAADKTGYTVINEAVNSSTAYMLFNGTDGVHTDWNTYTASASAAAYVVICFGSLDQYTWSTTQFFSQLQSLYLSASVHGIKVVFMTPFVNSASGTATYAQTMRDFAAGVKAPLIDLYTYSNNYVASHSGVVTDYVPDGVHPNLELLTAAGHWIASQWDPVVINGTGTGGTGGGGGGTTTGIYPVGQPTTGWTLTFNEEFDGTALDTTRWNTAIWYESPDPTINYRVANGQLDIWPAAGFVPRTIDTDGKFYQTYGYFEAEMKLPIGKGCWPAFWLYNHDVAAERPEIDIMEAYSGGTDAAPQPGWADDNYHPITAQMTVHYPVTGGESDLAGSYKTGDFLGTMDLSAAFHTYAVKWESSGCTFYLDGQQVGPKITNQSAKMNRRMYIMLDLWFGSASQDPDTSTPTGPSNSFSIKYVRAWQFA